MVEIIAEPTQVADRQDFSPMRFRRWTRGLDVVLLVYEGDDLAFEARAANGRLRERSYSTRHQVLNMWADPEWAAARASGLFDTETLGTLRQGVEQELILPSGPVVARLLATGYGEPPPTVRVWGWSWEVYRHARLEQCSGVAAAALPQRIGDYSFLAGLLFTASTSNAASLHVIWGSGANEIELVIGEHEGATAETDRGSGRVAGSVRFADVHADDHHDLPSAMEVLDLDRLASLIERMPVEESPGRLVWP